LDIGPHSSFTYFTLLTDRVAWSVCLCMSVYLSVTVVSPAKTAEPIEIPFELWTWVCRRKHLLHGSNWRNLTNTIEPSMCVGDAAFLSCYLDHLLWSPYGIGQTIIFSCCYLFFFFFFFLFFSPNFSRRRLAVCHTSTHGVALVRI